MGDNHKADVVVGDNQKKEVVVGEVTIISVLPDYRRTH